MAQQMESRKWSSGTACDVCIEPKLKAKKSCLVCLLSYCSAHLVNHYSAKRLRGHKLVQPLKNLDARACLTHGRSLELFSRRQQTCICVQCVEGSQEDVVSAEEEWHKKKEQLEWCHIEAVFTAVVAIVEAANARIVKPLKDRRLVLEKEAKDLKDELEGEINRLETTIAELDNLSALEDHIYFLQRYPLLCNQDNMKNWTNVQLDTSLSFGSMRETTTAMMKHIQQELEKLVTIELKRLPTFKADVKLDPNTAHPRLILSPDGKEVRDGGANRDAADSPNRFDVLGSVLGLNSLKTGKSYWEVEVGNKTGWDLGVARGSADRKGRLTLSPDNGYWVLVHYEEENYAAMTAPPIRLFLQEKPQTVGVFVDYEDGLVSFYDVTTQSHIYSFTECSFRDEIYPYFSPHFKEDGLNSAALVISSGKKKKELK